MTASIIRYLDPMTGDLHNARFADSILDEVNFPSLGEGNQPLMILSENNRSLEDN